ncbi:MAG: site-2 protease family protein, partial [Patescibacteria group bacterium]
NNILSAVIFVFFFQILGWKRDNLSSRELVKTIAITPVKIVARFFYLLFGCITFGFIKPPSWILVSTGKIHPPKLIREFMFFSLVLGLFNLAPISMLDGGQIAKTVIQSMGYGEYLAMIPQFVSSLVLMFLIIIANVCLDLRLFEFDLKQEKTL